MEPFYRAILKRSWQVFKKYKFLWFLGFLTAWLGSSFDFMFFFDYTYRFNTEPSFFMNLKDYLLTTPWSSFLFSFGLLPSLGKILLIVVFIFTLILTFFLFWLSLSSKAGIFNAINEIEENHASGFSANFKIGNRYFWPILGVFILVKLIYFILLVVILNPLMIVLTTNNSQALYFVSTLAFLIFLPIVIIIGFIMNYAVGYLVINGLKFKEALIASWQLFIKNWLISIEMAFILFLISIIAGLIFIALVFVVSSPFLLMIVFSQSTYWFYLLYPLMILVIFIFLIIFTVFLTVYQNSSWALLFLKLNKGKLVSKLERLTSPITQGNLKK